MKNAAMLLLAFGLAFAGQIVNVGETLGGSSSGSGEGAPPPADAECYNQYAQCLRSGCAAAHGSFSEQTQGCYGGDDAAFAKSVGECADAQGECVMGAGGGYSGGAGSGGGGASEGGRQGGLCTAGLALAFLLAAAYPSAKA